MNANELADELLYRYADEGGNFYGDDIHKDVIQMLRQFDLAESIIKQKELEIRALRNQVRNLKSEIYDWENVNAVNTSQEYVDKTQNNQHEPVAWMLIRNESCVEVTEWYGVMRGWEEFLGDNEKIVELYTHPVKEQEPDLYSEDGFPLWTIPQFKELTDEEIDELANKYLYVLNDVPYANDIKDFARAILRKAQEK